MKMCEKCGYFYDENSNGKCPNCSSENKTASSTGIVSNEKNNTVKKFKYCKYCGYKISAEEEICPNCFSSLKIITQNSFESEDSSKLKTECIDAQNEKKNEEIISETNHTNEANENDESEVNKSVNNAVKYCTNCGKKLSDNDTICPNCKHAFTDKLPNTPDDNSLQSSEFKTTESVREEINSETNVHLNDFNNCYGDLERRKVVNNYKKTALIVLGIMVLLVVAVIVAVYFS